MGPLRFYSSPAHKKSKQGCKLKHTRRCIIVGGTRVVHGTAAASNDAELLKRHEQNGTNDVVDPTTDQRVGDDEPDVEIPYPTPQE